MDVTKAVLGRDKCSSTSGPSSKALLRSPRSLTDSVLCASPLSSGYATEIGRQLTNALANAGGTESTFLLEEAETLTRSCYKRRRPRLRAWLFCFVYSLLACDPSDHGEVIYSPFPVRCPRRGGSLQAPLLTSAQACPENLWWAPRKLQKKGQKEKSERVGQRKGRRKEHHLRRPCGRHVVWCGQEQRRFPRSAQLLQLRHRAHRVLLCLSRHPPSHIRRGEEVQYRPAASPIGEEVPHLPPVLPPPRLLLRLRPQDLLLRLPLGALLEEVVPRLRPGSAPPALWGESALRPVEILPGYHGV